MNISIIVLTYFKLIMIIFMCTFACFNSACVINALTAIVKSIELNVNAL